MNKSTYYPADYISGIDARYKAILFEYRELK